MYTTNKNTKNKYLSKDGQRVNTLPDMSNFVKDDGSTINISFVINICDECFNVIAQEFGYDTYPTTEQVRFAILKHEGCQAFINRVFTLEY